MIKYKSNTYYLFDNLPFIIIWAGISIFLTYFFRDKPYLFLGTLVLSLFILFLIITQLRKLARVEFYENNILIKYLFTGSEEHIEYSAIKEYQHLQGFRLTGLNVIIYIESGTSIIKKLKITSVVKNNEFVEFARWIKQRNNDIKFKFFPSDIKLFEEYKKELNT